MDSYQPLIKIIDEQIYHSTSMAFIELRKQINERRLYVLFEDILHCDVNTDHLNSKSVLPIFEQFLSQAQHYIEQQGSKLVDIKIITFIDHLIREQVQQIAELQEALINEGFNTILISLIENGQSKMVGNLQNQLFSVQQYYNKIIKNIMETKVSLAKIGSLYQADPLEFQNIMNKEPNYFQKISEQQNQIVALSNLNNILTEQITKSSKNNAQIVKTMKKESQDLRNTCQKQKKIMDQTENQMKEYINKIQELETLLTSRTTSGAENEQKQIIQLQQSNIQLSKNIYKQLDAMDKLAAVVNAPKLRPSQKLVKKAKFQVQKSINIHVPTQNNSSLQYQLGNQSQQADLKISNSSQTQMAMYDGQIQQQQLINNSKQDIHQNFSEDHQIGEEFDTYIDNLQTVIDALAIDGAKIITQEEEDQTNIYYQQLSQNAQLTESPCNHIKTFDICVQTLESYFPINFQSDQKENYNTYRHSNITNQLGQSLRICDQISQNQSTLLQNNQVSESQTQQSLSRLIQNPDNRDQNFQQLNMGKLQNTEKIQLPELNQQQIITQQVISSNHQLNQSTCQQQNSQSAQSITEKTCSAEQSAAHLQIQQQNMNSLPCLKHQKNCVKPQQLISSTDVQNSTQSITYQQLYNDQKQCPNQSQQQQESSLYNQETDQPLMQNQFSQTEIIYLKENSQWDDQLQTIKDPFVGQLLDCKIQENLSNVVPSLHIGEIIDYYAPFLMQNQNYQLNHEGHLLDQQGNIIKTKMELERDMYIQSNHKLQQDEYFDFHGNLLNQNGIIKTHKEIQDEHNQLQLVNSQNQIMQQNIFTRSLHPEHIQLKENIVFKFIHDVFDIHPEETPIETLQVLLINSLKTLLISRQREGQVIQKLSDQISSQADVLKEAQQLFNNYMEQRFSKAVQTQSNDVESYPNDITLAIRETNSLLHKQKLKVRIPEYLQTSKDVQKRLQFYEQLARKRAGEVLYQQNPKSISVFDRAMSRTTVTICNLNEVAFQQNNLKQRK